MIRVDFGTPQEDVEAGGRIILRRILKEMVWTGFIWFRTGTGGRLL
jgi:hypothetical protein